MPTRLISLNYYAVSVSFWWLFAHLKASRMTASKRLAVLVSGMERGGKECGLLVMVVLSCYTVINDYTKSPEKSC